MTAPLTPDQMLQAVKTALKLDDDKLRKFKDWYGLATREGRTPFKIANGDDELFPEVDRVCRHLAEIPESEMTEEDSQNFPNIFAMWFQLQPWILPYGGQDSDEHYTPAEYVEPARRVMGSIDVDPASNRRANKIIKASISYDANNSGLKKEWRGNVWLNPPYSKIVSRFIFKLIKEHEAGRTKQAIVLWYVPLGGSKAADAIRRTANAMCVIPKDRPIKFIRPNGKTKPIGYQNLFYYLGPNVDKFTEEFERLGQVMVRP